MGETRGDNEPSMEEILASIRRIISEDSDPKRPSGSGGREAEVLDLTEMLTADGSVVSLASRRPGIATSGESQPTPESVKPEPAKPDAVKPDTVKPDTVKQDLRRPGGSSAVVHLSEKEHDPIMSEAEARASMISDTTLEASATSLGRLARAVRREAALRAFSGEEDRRIEDLVRESLTPMLRDWVDRHLPEMVDRIVREEIDKMVRRLQES
jgi:cell pole-organizing protein PopZ